MRVVIAEDAAVMREGPIRLLADRGHEDRVADVAEFADCLARVAGGGTALDPEVVSQLLAAGRTDVAALTGREREVLTLMAEVRSNAGIGLAVVLSTGAVEKARRRHFRQAWPAAI